mgnify:CR=1 FL=1|jgi:hypothetical protein
MKKVIIGMLLLTSLIGSIDIFPTMTLLIPKSSVILTDSEGDSNFYRNPSIKQWRIREITETQFEVL